MPTNIFPNVSTTYGAEASPFSTALFTNSTASSAQLLSPPGFYFIVTGAQNNVQFTDNMGTTYRTLIPVSSQGMVWSDGTTVQITNTSTGGSSARYYQILAN